MNRIVLILILLTLNPAPQATAQNIWPLNGFFKQMPRQQYDRMQYDYKVVLENLSTGERTDSMTGHLMVCGKQFTDSNRLFFGAKTLQYYCKLDHMDKTAIIYNLEELSRKMKMPLIDEPETIAGATEELLNSRSEQVTYDISNRLFYRVTVSYPDQEVSQAQLDFRKSDSSFLAAKFTLKDNEPGSANQYARTYTIYNVHKVKEGSSVDLSRVFTLKDGQPVLSRKYADYKLIKIIP